MKLTILIARLGHETKVAIVHAGNQAGLAMVAQVLDQLYPDATIIILTEHGLNVYARTVKEIVDDHATANRIANLPQHVALGEAIKANTAPQARPRSVLPTLEDHVAAIGSLYPAPPVAIVDDQPAPRNPDADDDEPAAAPRRRTDDDEVARP